MRNNPELDKLLVFDCNLKIMGQATLNSLDVGENISIPAYFKEANSRNMKYKVFIKQISNRFFISIPVIRDN